MKKATIEDQNKLLKLIEEGDTFSLLSEENLGEGFNELMKNELITITDGKIQITETGKEAKTKGIREVLAKRKANVVAVQLPVKAVTHNRKLYLYLFLISTFILSVFLTITMMI